MSSQEVWKEISHKKFSTDKYLISSHGRVMTKRTKKIRTTNSLRGGYKSTTLKGIDENGNKYQKALKIHQLVARAFIPNDDPKKIYVNHKDGNKLNNHVDNLEWITPSENVKHSIRTGLATVTKRKVLQLKMDGKLVKEHDTIRGAGKATGIDSGSIAKCCKGTRISCGGFKWKFSEENPNEGEIDLKDYVPTKDFPNYMINKEGNIYSKPYKKLMKKHQNNDGYQTVNLSKNNKSKSFLIHRLVAEHFIPKIEGKTKVNHKDGNKINNHVDNLEWCDDSENNMHRHKLNKSKTKEDNTDESESEQEKSKTKVVKKTIKDESDEEPKQKTKVVKKIIKKGELR